VHELDCITRKAGRYLAQFLLHIFIGYK